MQAFAKLLGNPTPPPSSSTPPTTVGLTSPTATPLPTSSSSANSTTNTRSTDSASSSTSLFRTLYSPYLATSAAPNTNPSQPRTTPLAHFASHPPPFPTGSLLDVNATYIVYAVKGGLVRVLDRRTASRTLLRGHTVRVSDVKFFKNSNADGGAAGAGGDGADILATVGGRGDAASVIVWRLYRQKEADGSGGKDGGELQSEKLLEVRFRPAVRLVWHPYDPNKFVLVHAESEDGVGVDPNAVAASESTAVATLVETTRLLTVPHSATGHAVCLCGGEGAAGAASAGDDGVGGSVIAGAVRLIVPGGRGVGINDLVYSSHSARHVLTAHDDGKVRLWDTGTTTSALGGNQISATILQTLTVSCGGPVMRCAFLGRYGDARRSNLTTVAGSGTVEEGSYLTPPFLTGHDGNAALTLWSPFAGTGSPPAKVSTFVMVGDEDGEDGKGSDSMSLALCDVPSANAAATTSASAVDTFAFLASLKTGSIYALHLSSSSSSSDNNSSRTVTGFDYVTPLRTVHPIYSWSVITVPGSSADSSGDGGDDTNEHNVVGNVDVGLFCVQSKAVQMLALTPAMLAPPTSSSVEAMRKDGGTLPPGVSIVEDAATATTAASSAGGGGGHGATTVTGDEGAMANAGATAAAADVEFDDYDTDEDAEMEYNVKAIDTDEDDDDDGGAGAAGGAPPPASSLPLPPGLGPALTPTPESAAAAAAQPDPFANWLGSLAGPAAAAAPHANNAAVSPPPVPAPIVSSSSIGTTSLLANRHVSRQQSTGGPPGVPPTPASTPAIVPKKEAMGAGGLPAGFLSPMEFLTNGGVAGDGAGGGGGQSELEKALGALPTADAPQQQQRQPKQADKKAKSQRAKSNPKGKKPSTATGNNKGGSGGAPAAGKIAILKREDRAASSAEVQEAATATATAAAPPSVAHAAVDVDETIRLALSKHQPTLLAEISQTIKSEFNGSVVPSLDRAVQKSLDKTVTGPLRNSIETMVKDGERVRTDKVVEAVAEGVKGPVVEAFHGTMRDVLVPAYEAATRQMFAQVSTAIQSGLASQQQQQRQPSPQDEATLRLVQSMSTQMETMARSIESLTAEVTQLRMAVGSTAGAGGGNAAPGAGSPLSQQQRQADAMQALRDEIMILLERRDYETAFTKALSASDGDVAVLACKNAPISDVLEGSAPALSQPILLCLMQQLGAVLASSSDSDLRVELAWLQDIAVTLNPNDESIRRHVGGVLQQLVANVNSKMAEGDPALRRPLQMLLQVIRGIGGV